MNDISRRDLLKTGAAGGAATLGIASSTTPAAATVSGLDIVTMGPQVPTSTVRNTAGKVTSFISGLTADPTHDRYQLWHLAVNEAEWLTINDITMGNHLEDTATISEIEARAEIAASWESGAAVSDAHQNSLDRVREYFRESVEHNLVESGNKALIQHGYVTNAGLDTDPVFPVQAAAQDSNGNGYVLRISPDRTASTMTLHDGTEHTVGGTISEDDETPEIENAVTPIIKAYDGDPEADGTSKVGEYTFLSDEVLDSYDETANESDRFTLTTDGGTDITTGFRFTVQNVTVDGEDDLLSRTVFDGVEFKEQLDEIANQSDTVVANYTQSFVEDLYAELDAGNITPDEVRGSAGMARYLSGQDDASGDRYRLALMHQLGMNQVDLSNVASMTVEYTGYTGIKPITDDTGTRRVYPSNHVETTEYKGQLFAQTDLSELLSGETYSVGRKVFLGDENGNLMAYNIATQTEVWSRSDWSDFLNGVGVSNRGDLVVVGSQTGSVAAIDGTNGDTLWTASYGKVRGLEVSADGSMVAVGTGGSVELLDAADGSTIHSSGSAGQTEDAAFSPDGSTYYAAGGSGIYAYSVDDGSQLWSYSNSNQCSSVTAGPNGDAVYGADWGGNAFRINDSDGTGEWTYSIGSRVYNVTASSDGETVYGGSYSPNAVFAVNASDGSEVWQNSVAGDNAMGIELSPDESQVLLGASNLRGLDASDGSELWSKSLSASIKGSAVTGRTDDSAGMLANASMFHAPEGEDIDLTEGAVTITSITDRDGNELDSTDYTEPGYDQYDSAEWVKTIKKVEEVREVVKTEETTLSPGGLPGWPDTPDLSKIAAGVVLLLGAGAVAIGVTSGDGG